MPDAVAEVLEELRRIRVPSALNIYAEEDSVSWGDLPGQATERLLALERYLRSHWSAPVVLVGEAPGKEGARWSGVPFTSQRQMSGSGPAEATATIMQRVLSDLRCEHDVLLWNASMLFAAGNRNPLKAEVVACSALLERVCRSRTVLAVGRVAEAATGAVYIRHPSHGGGPRFSEELRAELSLLAGRVQDGTTTAPTTA
jgi:hypothetical protein